MKTYIPTEEELRELGFEKQYGTWIFKITDIRGNYILQIEYLSEWIIFGEGNMARKFKPTKSDIETIIRLFTKPE